MSMLLLSLLAHHAVLSACWTRVYATTMVEDGPHTELPFQQCRDTDVRLGAHIIRKEPEAEEISL